MMRRHGFPPQKATSYRTRPGAYAILPRRGRLLLTFQAEPWPEIQLPGGGIDRGESPLAALCREVLEETGFTIARPRHLVTYRRFVYMPEYGIFAEKICRIFVAHPARRLGPPREPGHQALWLPVDEALDALQSEGDAEALWQARRAGLTG